MALQNGIKICKETLLKLSSSNAMEQRIDNAYNEMGMIGYEDISLTHFKEFVDWAEKYHLAKKYDIKLDGTMTKLNDQTDKQIEFARLSTILTELCIKIIEHNSGIIKK